MQAKPAMRGYTTTVSPTLERCLRIRHRGRGIYFRRVIIYSLVGHIVFQFYTSPAPQQLCKR